MSKRPPFSSTEGKNSFFKSIRDNKASNFWKMHCATREEGLDFYSEEFRDLVTGMLLTKPVQRITLSDVKNHPWFKKEVIDKKEIIERFSERQARIEQAMTEDIQGDLEVSLGFDGIQASVHRGVDDEDNVIVRKLFL